MPPNLLNKHLAFIHSKYSFVGESFSTALKKLKWFSEKIYFDILNILLNSIQKQPYYFITKKWGKNTFNNKCFLNKTKNVGEKFFWIKVNKNINLSD